MQDEKIKIEMTLDEWADIQHQIWSAWMTHLFSCGIFTTVMADKAKSGFLIAEDKANRWAAQAQTDYKDLSEDEKESDRHVVRQFFLREKNAKTI